MIYETKDGVRVKGATARDVVAKLNKIGLKPSVSPREYVKEVAARLKKHYDYRVRTARYQDFLDDLVAHGLLTRGR